MTDLPPDWREEYEERAARMEYCAGLDRETAEQRAYALVKRRMEAANAPRR